MYTTQGYKYTLLAWLFLDMLFHVLWCMDVFLLITCTMFNNTCNKMDLHSK